MNFLKCSPLGHNKCSIGRRFSFNGWLVLRAISVIGVILPFVALLRGVFSSDDKYWKYVKENLLGTYFTETLLLTVCGGIGAFLLGILLAWFISIYDFPGKKFFRVALVLPLAIPPYIAAYTYEGLLGYTGIVQKIFRNYFDVNLSSLTLLIPAQAWAVWIFCITLFPYVYIFVISSLKNQSASIFENALLLGGGRTRLFLKVGFPLLRPAAVAGVVLVCLEILNDFGVAKFYGLNTFATAIFTSWFGMGDIDTAIKLAIILLIIVCIILFARRALYNAKKYQIVSSKEKPLLPIKAKGLHKIAIILLCCFVCFLGFIAPLIQMLYWLTFSWRTALNTELYNALLYTIYISFVATFVIIIFATANANASRLFGGKYSSIFVQITTIGYSVPSSVLAIGVISLFVSIDNLAVNIFTNLPTRFISMTSILLAFAYCIRFFSIGYNGIEAGFAKNGMVYTEVSRTLGRSVTKTFFLVNLPMIFPAIISASALVFIDILKELPLGMMLRPFNTETLGTTVYHYANNEVLENTALPSLCIVLVGAIFIIFVQIIENKKGKNVFRN
ncbi:MAG: ABC transporter permease [Campylobacteraceae bacterium]